MSYESERLKILEMIDNGLITVDEGVVLLKALDQRGTEQSSIPEQLISTEEIPSAPEGPEPVQTEVVEPVVRPEPVIEPEPVVIDSEQLNARRSEEVQFTSSTVSTGSVHTPEPESIPEEKFSAPRIDPNMRKWRNYWWIPMSIGVAITVISAVLMYVAWENSGYGFWFACTWFPFALGVLVIALAYGSRTARWLHVRIHQKPGERPQNIAISLPLPLRFTAWFLRTFKGYIPELRNTGLDEIIMALHATNSDTPFYVEVDEGDSGERVEVYIG
jgi:hypothetical protein